MYSTRPDPIQRNEVYLLTRTIPPRPSAPGTRAGHEAPQCRAPRFPSLTPYSFRHTHISPPSLLLNHPPSPRLRLRLPSHFPTKPLALSDHKKYPKTHHPTTPMPTIHPASFKMATLLPWAAMRDIRAAEDLRDVLIEENVEFYISPHR